MIVKDNMRSYSEQDVIQMLQLYTYKQEYLAFLEMYYFHGNGD